MSDPSNIVPFGKYKGRLIDELLVDDPDYLKWLSGQDRFRAKFSSLYTVIINRGNEPTETPEHNALQVLFLADDFCERFIRHLHPDIEGQARQELSDRRQAKIEKLQKEIVDSEKHLPSVLKYLKKDKNDKHWLNCVDLERQGLAKNRKQLSALLALEISGIIAAISFQEKEFEKTGVDVRLRGNMTTRSNCEATSDYFGYAIEIKPVVGDDYPAVLRQMRANGSNILFTERYTGTGATEAQFVKTFALSDIKIVFRRDVDAMEDQT
jgi:hypothetical protein